jgi:hypothetical protein
MPGAEVTIDGTTVPTVSGSVTPRLNRPAQGTVRIPLGLDAGDIGSKIQITLDDVLALSARCTFVETDTEEDGGYTEFQATGPLEITTKRPARDSTGDFSKPEIFTENTTAPQIAEAIFNASQTGGGPSITEGPLGFEVGTFEVGGVDVSGAPTDWPMTIAEICQLLISTGQLDLVEVPIVDAVNYARVDGYNGDYGTDLSGTVSIDYGRGNFNASKCKWTKDLGPVVNKLWTYLGPRVGTSADPAGDQHWRANITGTTNFAAVGMDPPATAVLARRATSQTDYGVRMQIDIFDADNEAIVGMRLFQWRWLAQSWAAAVPQELVYMTPTAGLIPFGTFGVGDLITVSANSDVRGGFNGAQRVYEYTASWDEDSVISISELQTSPQNEGFD